MRLIPKQITRKMTHELHTKTSARNNFGNKGAQESQVTILWNCGLWAHHVVFLYIGAVTSCTVMISRHVREYHVSYADCIVGIKGEGRREPFSCSLNEADN